MKRTVALPFLTILNPSERTSKKIGRWHKSPQRSAEQVCHLLRRWFPKHIIVFVADAGYATTGLFRACRKLKINLVTRAKSNFRFFTSKGLIREHQLFQVWTRHPILRNIQCPHELLSILEGIGMAA